jgi:predicted ATPase
VGKVVWPAALEAIGDRGPREVDEGLRELARRQLIRPSRRSSVAGQSEHAFWHLSIREAALEHMDSGRRAAAHRAALEWAEHMNPDRTADHAEILTYHAVRAESAPAGSYRRYLRLAADRAAALDPARAAELYERAAGQRPDGSTERSELLLRAAAAADAAGD